MYNRDFITIWKTHWILPGAFLAEEYLVRIVQWLYHDCTQISFDGATLFVLLSK